MLDGPVIVSEEYMYHITLLAMAATKIQKHMLIELMWIAVTLYECY